MDTITAVKSTSEARRKLSELQHNAKATDARVVTTTRKLSKLSERASTLQRQLADAIQDQRR
jgi:chaperonin cofactor prefoldin